MAITRESKENQVAELAEKLKTSKSMVATDFRGLKMEEISELRKSLKKSGSDYKVVKITLLERAAKEAGFEEFEVSAFKGHPLAVSFGYEDVVAPAKIIFDQAKKNSKLEIVAGLLDGKVLTAGEVKNLAMLPSKEELLARVVGTLNAPISNFVSVLHGNLRSLVYVLDAINNKKSA